MRRPRPTMSALSGSSFCWMQHPIGAEDTTSLRRFLEHDDGIERLHMPSAQARDAANNATSTASRSQSTISADRHGRHQRGAAATNSSTVTLTLSDRCVTRSRKCASPTTGIRIRRLRPSRRPRHGRYRTGRAPRLSMSNSGTQRAIGRQPPPTPSSSIRPLRRFPGGPQRTSPAAPHRSRGPPTRRRPRESSTG